MFRTLGIVLLFSICTYLGYYYGERYKNRCKQLKELQKSLVLMNSEILYSNTPLPNVFFNVSNKLSGPFKKIYLELAEVLASGVVESVFEGFYNSYRNNNNELSLKNEDVTVAMDFFNSLGETGVYGQEKIFNLTLDRLKKNYEDSENESKIYSKMYRTLGLCVGAVLAIFFI